MYKAKWWTAQEDADRLKEKPASQHYPDGKHQCVKEPRTCHRLCILRILSAKLSGDIVARTIAEEERERLYEEHHAEHYTYCCCWLRVYLSYKKSVNQIIHACQQHRYDCRQSHCTYHSMDWRMGKKLIFFVHIVYSIAVCLHKTTAKISTFYQLKYDLFSIYFTLNCFFASLIFESVSVLFILSRFVIWQIILYLCIRKAAPRQNIQASLILCSRFALSLHKIGKTKHNP